MPPTTKSGGIREIQGDTERKGPDAAATLRTQDYLQCWRVARNVYELIKTCPPHWSLRIGVFGHWGEGKTTVLRFIETMAEEDGYPIAWFNPWSIENRSSMWEALSNAVERALGRSRLTGSRLKQMGKVLLKGLDVAMEIL